MALDRKFEYVLMPLAEMPDVTDEDRIKKAIMYKTIKREGVSNDPNTIVMTNDIYRMSSDEAMALLRELEMRTSPDGRERESVVDAFHFEVRPFAESSFVISGRDMKQYAADFQEKLDEYAPTSGNYEQHDINFSVPEHQHETKSQAFYTTRTNKISSMLGNPDMVEWEYGNTRFAFPASRVSEFGMDGRAIVDVADQTEDKNEMFMRYNDVDHTYEEISLKDFRESLSALKKPMYYVFVDEFGSNISIEHEVGRPRGKRRGETEATSDKYYLVDHDADVRYELPEGCVIQDMQSVGVRMTIEAPASLDSLKFKKYKQSDDTYLADLSMSDLYEELYPDENTDKNAVVMHYQVSTDKKDMFWSNKVQGNIRELPNGMIEYDGELGSFAYDPNEYEFQSVEHFTDTGESVSMSYLHYIGDEVDGSKIRIPDGLRDASFLFAETDIESVPQIPDSVNYAAAMCTGCDGLTDVSATKFPAGMTDASMFFCDCENLTKGCDVPGTVRNASSMYLGCSAMENCPNIEDGVKDCSHMFGSCTSMTEKPFFPSSVEKATFATDGCLQLDANEQSRYESEYAADIKAINDKYDRKEKHNIMSRGLGYALAVMAYRRSYSDIFVTMYNVYKNGNDFSLHSGLQAFTMSSRNKNGFMSVVGNALKVDSEEKSRKLREARELEIGRVKNAMLRTENGMAVDYGNALVKDKYAEGYRIAADKRFSVITYDVANAAGMDSGAYEVDQFIKRTRTDLESNIDTMSAKEKNDTAKQILSMFSAERAFYMGSSDAIDRNADRFGQIEGEKRQKYVDQANMDRMGSLMDFAVEAQSKYGLFSKHQMQLLGSALVKDTAYAGTKECEDNLGALKDLSAQETSEYAITPRRFKLTSLEGRRLPNIDFGDNEDTDEVVLDL